MGTARSRFPVRGVGGSIASWLFRVTVSGAVAYPTTSSRRDGQSTAVSHTQWDMTAPRKSRTAKMRSAPHHTKRQWSVIHTPSPNQRQKKRSRETRIYCSFVREPFSDLIVLQGSKIIWTMGRLKARLKRAQPPSNKPTTMKHPLPLSHPGRPGICCESLGR